MGAKCLNTTTQPHNNAYRTPREKRVSVKFLNDVYGQGVTVYEGVEKAVYGELGEQLGSYTLSVKIQERRG